MFCRLVWRGWFHDQRRYEQASQMARRETHGAPRPGHLLNGWETFDARSSMQMSAFATATAMQSPQFTVRTEFSRDLMDMMTAEQQNAMLMHAYERNARALLRAQQDQMARLAVKNPFTGAIIKSE